MSFILLVLTWTFVSMDSFIPQFLTKIFLRILGYIREEAVQLGADLLSVSRDYQKSSQDFVPMQSSIDCSVHLRWQKVHFSHSIGAVLSHCRGRKKSLVKKFEDNCRRKQNFIIVSPGRLIKSWQVVIDEDSWEAAQYFLWSKGNKSHFAFQTCCMVALD